ncbi:MULTISPECIES: ABC transporter permease [unclassified Thermococcus]|uniref:ABC transporter permease n=1 Tax=unclassified Thermococcus TaxID=2627626 RepID=UPI00143A9E5E|nr:MULTISPECIES: FtsX-like permease family protein [unclassified Thermococcus]
MKLRATLRKLKHENKKAVIVFLAFLFVSLGFNFALSGIGSISRAVEDFAKLGNVELEVEGVSVEDLSKFGEVINYVYFNDTKIEFNGKKYRAVVGYGEFKSLHVKTPEDGVVVLAFPEVKKGDKIKINGKEYGVKGSYYYFSGIPFVLVNEKGQYLYVLMRCNDTEALASFLMKNARVRYFFIYNEGEMPYMDALKNIKKFVMSFFYLLLGASLAVIVLVTITHVKGSVREVGVLKALGIPDSFISTLFVGDFLLIALVAYLIGIPLGINLGCFYIASRFPIPTSPDYIYPLKFDIFILLGITLILSLPYLYVSRLKIIEALRFTPRKSHPLRFFATFFIIFLATSSAYFGIKGVENLISFNYSYNLMVWGDPAKITQLPGEKAGYLSGQKVDRMTTEVYFFDYKSIFEKTLIAGRWFEKPDEAVIEKGLAKKLDLKVGDTIKVQILGEWREYKIVGISNMNFYDFKAVFLPKVPFVPDKVAFLNVENPEGLKEKYEKLGLSAVTMEDLKRRMESNLMIFKTAVYGVIGIILFISVFALFALIYLEIESNEKVYATLKAVGIPNSHVWKEFLKNALPSLIASSLLALPISLKIGGYIGNLVLPVEFSINDLAKVVPLLLVLYLLYGIFIVLLTNRALNKLDVVKALRS